MLVRLRRRLERVRLTRASLIRMALGIFGACFAIAAILSAFLPGPSFDERATAIYLERGPREGERILVEHLREHPEDRGAWLVLVKKRAQTRYGLVPKVPKLPELFREPSRPRSLEFHEPGLHLDDADFDALLATCRVIPVEILRAWRDAVPLDAALSHLGGGAGSLELELALAGAEICAQSRDPRAESLAVEWFARARALGPTDRRAVTGWLEALEKLGREDEIEIALADPGVRAAVDPGFLYQRHVEKKEYLPAAVPLWRSVYESYGPGIWITCIAVGACWTLLLGHLALGLYWRRSLQILVPLALLLGWASADATLLAVVVTEDWTGEAERFELPTSIFFALQIGLREEVLKLLFLAPLTPYLVRKGSDIQALVIASLVGLGFAVHENASYYIGSGGGAIIGRYITANFFHLALTGYVGYHWVRAVRRGGEDWAEFFRALVKVIVFHAAYDFFLIDRQLSDYAFLSIALFIILSQQYLRLAFRLRPHRFQRVSLTRIFVAALATVTGMHYLYLSTRLGLGEALWQTMGGLLGVAIIAFMYFQEFDERVA